jgi:hypothetical protein
MILLYVSLLAGMRVSPQLRTGVLITSLCLCVQGQDTQGKAAQTEARGIPPRAAPADYLTQGQAGTVTIAAEFKGHSVPTPDATLSTEEYVAVEVALFGPPEARLKLSFEDFSIRINAKKAPTPSSEYASVFASLRDPEWEPPEKAEKSESKSKTSIGGGGRGGQTDSNMPPPVVHIPIELQRAMQQKVRKSALPEGDRALPQAGLIFFQYRGKAQGIHSIELIYAGPAGTATLALQP